ncbi:MAG: SH3 domain-containing protein [Lachnospiraceae bacterium]|nr:SH3 domain-containing protein [Lachnospiraceae bacterium]
MNYRNVKTMMLALICMAAVLFPTFETEAAELSDLVNAGIASAIEQVDDETVLAAAVAPSVVEGYNLLGVVTAESGYINIREEMSTESKIVGKIRKNGICEVVSIENEWSEIESGEIKGYISNDYLYTGAEAWILAGGAHHTAFSYDLSAEQMGDWANAMGIEAVYIDKDTNIRNFKKDLMLGEIFYR